MIIDVKIDGQTIDIDNKIAEMAEDEYEKERIFWKSATSEDVIPFLTEDWTDEEIENFIKEQRSIYI